MNNHLGLDKTLDISRLLLLIWRFHYITLFSRVQC